MILLVMTDGRKDCLIRTMASFEQQVTLFDICQTVIHVDGGDEDYTSWVRGYFPYATVVAPPTRIGYAGSLQNIWTFISRLEPLDEWVFHLEDDFLFTRPADLGELRDFLIAYPNYAQMAYRRNAVGSEIPFGGYIQQSPHWYEERSDDRWTWVETRRNWTSNPSLHRSALCGLGWPQEQYSEGVYGFWLRGDRGLPWGVPPEDVVFGLWGGIESGRNWVQHIGDERLGTGY